MPFRTDGRGKHEIAKLLGHYWQSSDKKFGIFLAASVLILGIIESLLYVRYNSFYSDFYNALQRKDADAFWKTMPFLLGLLGAPLIIGVIKNFTESWLQLRWRASLTTNLINRWLSKSAYYRIERDQLGDNPDQRISEDASKLVQLSMTLSLRLITTLVSLGSFSYLTWTQGGDLDLDLFGIGLHIPGYMFWLAVAFAILDMLITHLSGWRLLGINVKREAAEAELRYALVQVRDNAEQIALYRGEKTELTRLNERFQGIWNISKKMFIVNFQVDVASGFTGRMAALLPILVMAPNLLSGKMDLGTVMATTAAWTSTASGFSWLANNYNAIMEWRASARRLRTLVIAVEAAPIPGIKTNQWQGNPALETKDLTIHLPDGNILANLGSVRLLLGERCIVKGPSGAGKSTLLRAFAGLWPYGSGSIEYPATRKVLFVPQRSYIPTGTLKEALCYPSSASHFSDTECNAALDRCQLSMLHDQLHQVARWSNILSGGEQQRLAFARVMLQKPHILFLDEATSALDLSTERNMYTSLIDSHCGLTIISVAHRDSLEQLHTRTIELSRIENTYCHSDASAGAIP